MSDDELPETTEELTPERLARLREARRKNPLKEMSIADWVLDEPPTECLYSTVTYQGREVYLEDMLPNLQYYASMGLGVISRVEAAIEAGDVENTFWRTRALEWWIINYEVITISKMDALEAAHRVKHRSRSSANNASSHTPDEVYREIFTIAGRYYRLNRRKSRTGAIKQARSEYIKEHKPEKLLKWRSLYNSWEEAGFPE